jgi:hypothetical protein
VPSFLVFRQNRSPPLCDQCAVAYALVYCKCLELYALVSAKEEENQPALQVRRKYCFASRHRADLWVKGIVI